MNSCNTYNIFRWYRSSFGRYTQIDPLAVSGSGSFRNGAQHQWPGPRRYVVIDNATQRNAAFVSDLNGYVYAGDDPPNVSDPTALDPLKCHINTLKPTPIAGWSPFLGTCENLYTGAVVLSAGMLKTQRCGKCPIGCEHFVEMLGAPMVTGSPWGVKCEWPVP